MLLNSSLIAESLNLQASQTSSEFCQGLRTSGKGIFPSERLMEDAYYIKYGTRVRCNAIPLQVLKREGKETYASLSGVYLGAVLESNDECGVVIYNAFVSKAKHHNLQTQEQVFQIMNAVKRDSSVMRAYQSCSRKFQ